MVIKEIVTVVLLVGAASCSNGTGQPRVIGGMKVAIEDYNYMASLQTLNGFQQTSLAILNEKWLIATANVITFLKPRNEPYPRNKYFISVSAFYNGTERNALTEIPPRDKYYVMVGSNKVRKCGEDAIVKHIANYYVHHRFNNQDEYGYSALVELSEPMEFGPKVGSIKLQSKENFDWPSVGQNCMAIGWGSETSNDPDVLRAMIVVVTATRQCKAAHTRTEVICTTSLGHPSYYTMLVCDEKLVAMSYSVWCDKNCRLEWYRLDLDLAWVKNITKPAPRLIPKSPHQPESTTDDPKTDNANATTTGTRHLPGAVTIAVLFLAAK